MSSECVKFIRFGCMLTLFLIAAVEVSMYLMTKDSFWLAPTAITVFFIVLNIIVGRLTRV